MKKLVFLLVSLLTPMLVGAQDPRPELKAGGPVPSWCANRTNSYCTYSWDWMNRCCNATYISPGAYCPSICE